MTKLKTKLLKDLPVKTTPITDDDYVVNTNRGTTKLKVKDITRGLAKRVDDLTLDIANKSNGTPLFVNTLEEMNDMTRNYVNMKNGYVYVYKEGSFTNSGVKYQQLGLSDRQVNKGHTTFYKKSLNLENKHLQVEGKGILTTTGELYDNPDLTSTEDFIDISCSHISLQKFDNNGVNINDNATAALAFYTKDSQFIKCIDIAVNNYVAVPPNATKIRYQLMNNLRGYLLNLYPTKELQHKYVEQYELEELERIYAYMEHHVASELGNVNQVIDKLKKGDLLEDKSITPSKTTFFLLSENLFNANALCMGAILKDNGILEPSFEEWRASDWIKVKANTTIYFSNNGEPFTTHLGALYNTSKEYLSPINDVVKVDVVEDGYMRVSQNGGFPSKYQVEVDKITNYKEFNHPTCVLNPQYLNIDIASIYDAIEEVKNGMLEVVKPYENKSYLFMGDSITRLDMSDNGWVKYFAEIMKPSKMVNISVNGATWKDYSDTPRYDGNPTPNNHLNVMGNQVQKVLNEKARGNDDYDNFDVIIMAAGTNDPFDRFTETSTTVEDEFVTSYVTGNYTVKPIDQVNRKTIPGAIRYAYEKLYALYPNAVFFVTTPLQEAYENYLDIKAKGDLIDYVADRLSITTINSRRCGILNTYESPVGDINYDNPTGSESVRKRDLSDGIHTNPSGGKKLGEFNAREVIKYYCV